MNIVQCAETETAIYSLIQKKKLFNFERSLASQIVKIYCLYTFPKIFDNFT